MYNFSYWFMQTAILFFILRAPATAEKRIASDNYNAFIENIESKLQELQQKELNTLKAKNSINNAKALYDPLFYAETQGYGIKNYDDFSDNDIYTLGLKPRAGVKKKLKTGTEISTEISFDFYQNRGKVQSWNFNEETYEFLKQKKRQYNNSIIPEFKIFVTQPLLLNKGGIIEKFTVKSSLYQFDIAHLTTKLEQNSIIDNYRKKYVRLLRLKNDTIFINNALTTVQEHEDRAKRLVSQGLLEKDEYAQISIFAIQLKERLAVLSAEIDIKTKDLSSFLPAGFTAEEFENIFTILREKNLLKVSFDSTTEGKVYSILQSESRENVLLRKNLKKPQFNLYGEGVLKHFSSRHKKPVKSKRIDYGINFTLGAQFTMALGNREAKSELQASQLNLQILEKEYEVSQRQYYENVKHLTKYFKLYQKLISQKIEIINVLQKKMGAEQKKFHQARLDLSDLLSSESSIIEEHIAINGYKENLISVMLDYFSLTM